MSMVRVRIHSTDGIPKYSGFLDKTDQYVTVKIGHTVRKTQTIMNAGSSATFDEEMLFEYHNEDTLQVDVYDYDVMTADDHIGTGVLPLRSPLLQSGIWNGEINIRSQTGKKHRTGKSNCRIP
eukprot:Blabericola_migrator_1__10154@NODE_5669_length_703_cov_60_638365_g3701_i0_p1_GENE_NODE_5669_length_703_cov_60_638365_g3701_i0NODE_5669_length_703_cov_60_638365_g3701_i0_p1_ORF_typecomplete_len123_score9_86C2/PF00168_30/1_6e14_NODE_5669_length_703_cov_60_638365_g3701_i0262630